MLIKDWIEYLHEYKRKEVAAAFEGFSAPEGSSCLEIGAGDGYEASLIKKYFKTIVSTECSKDFSGKTNDNISYIRCNAEDLPFEDKRFDFVFSSNVIEHIKDREKCFSEIKRVLKDKGTAIHIVPSRTWKMINNLLYYPYLIMLPFNVRRLKWHLKEETESDKSTRSLLRYIFLPIHGQYKNHIVEFIGYERKEWQRLFAKNGFKIAKVIKLPILSSGHGFKFGAINRFLERRGFSSSYVFFMKTRNK